MLSGTPNSIAPVVFIIFRRPDTTARVFEEIRRAQPSKLYVIADGARSGNSLEEELVQETRSVIDGVDWPCKVTEIFSDKNLGLRERILTGLDSVFAVEREAIIIEDDCLPSSSFFGYCSELLRRFEDKDEISLISGSNFAPLRGINEDYFFSNSMFIWGWATWARSWHEFRRTPQVEEWQDTDRDSISSTFSSRIQRKEFLNLMDAAKSLNTWDISLAVWMRQFNKISVIPRINLVENIGFGNEATHTKFEAFDVQVERSDFSMELIHPEHIAVSPNLDKRMWRVKSLRWITFPLSHPVDFIRRMWNFFIPRSKS
jgi:hypothetical protein